ncbi:MAG: histidine phosphatase family protein [Chloroflexi bacterium]|nr:histidine phosphatase family protein [Chloroflexota bacterium]MYF81074.1 histidine phosphatase family protein [Chloroflexota bacterium]MYI04271.1 histidine phosphatase family protein [Chloroflexota bacterium]
MNRILLVRHVESEANRSGVGLGRADSPPTELGLRQLEATVQALTDEPVTRVLTSPLSRARLLADGIARSHNLEAESSEGLIELDVGELEGVEWPIVRERFGKFLRDWRGDDSVRVPMPGGESLLDVLTRARPAFDELVNDSADGAAVIVTHNFVVKMLVTHALDMPPRAWRRIDTGLCGITAFRIVDGMPAVERLNDRHHLRHV